MGKKGKSKTSMLESKDPEAVKVCYFQAFLNKIFVIIGSWQWRVYEGQLHWGNQTVFESDRARWVKRYIFLQQYVYFAAEQVVSLGA